MQTKPEVRSYKKKSQFAIVMRRLAKKKLAMFGVIIIVLLILMAVFADYIAPYPYAEQDYTAILQKPSLTSGHLLGTDSLGRDLLSRIIYGTRYSLYMGLLSVLLAAVIGITLGSVAGYCGGMVDNLLMRFLDIYQSIPSLILSIALAAVLGAGMESAIIAIAFATTGGYARMIRASIMQESGKEYVEAARSIDAGNMRILIKHILPNAFSPMIVQISMTIGSAILMGATMSFIGLGAQPPIPEWGTLLADGRNFLRDSGYLLLAPGFMIFITVFAFNMLGDGLRDALDPRLKD